MKTRLTRRLTALMMLFVFLLCAVSASADISEEEAYGRIIAQQGRFPEGQRWNDDNIYVWEDVVGTDVYDHTTFTGYACVAFAYEMSDLVFGTDTKGTFIQDYTMDQIRVGDILRIDHDSHSVVVLEVRDNSVIVAEGNFNESIHWGRELKASDIIAPGNWLITRYTEPVAGAHVVSNPDELGRPVSALRRDADGILRCYAGDQVDPSANGLFSFEGNTYLVNGGIVFLESDGLINVNGEWLFFADGRLVSEYSGFAMYADHWFMINGGRLDTGANGFYDYNGATFLFAAGELKTDVSGLMMNVDGRWYFLSNGQFQSGYTGVAMYNGAWFYLENGVLADYFNGTIEYGGEMFTVVAGQLIV